MAIRILITGGTIDDLEYESIEDAPKEPKSLIPDALKQARVTSDYAVEELMQKDSRFVTDDDRENVFERCRDCEEERIIITHGTLSMPETAKYLGGKGLSKTIVLVGAAVPLNKEGSDGLFNLGAGFSAVQTLEKGVYVTMNGKIFPWDDVKKEKGVFVRER
jgi:L-asparaginase